VPHVPEVSVVIPARDAEEPLADLLDSLARQTLDADRFEVIVVENGSRDRTAEVAEERGARVLRETLGNRSRARNAGVAASEADVFAFTDADCVADPGWLEAMLACRGRAPLIAGNVRVSTRTPPNAVERFESVWRFAQEAWSAEGWAATANMLVEREAFEAIGGFDPTYRHIAEDADFCVRAGRAGFPLGYCDEGVVLHYAENELRPLIRRAFFHGYSSAQILRRLGVGHAAYRHPKGLVSRRAALAMVGIDASSLPPDERRRLGVLASATYVSRFAGSLWAVAQRAR
jgi:GT2 family glycosyltransferase